MLILVSCIKSSNSDILLFKLRTLANKQFSLILCVWALIDSLDDSSTLEEELMTLWVEVRMLHCVGLLCEELGTHTFDVVLSSQFMDEEEDL